MREIEKVVVEGELRDLAERSYRSSCLEKGVAEREMRYIAAGS